MSAPLLDARGVTKRFAGIVAVDGVDLDVAAGDFVAVIGPNGAGKTTLFNCLTGVAEMNGGSVSFDGQRLDGVRPEARASLGMARTFQRIELFGPMTVEDHLLVADRAHRRTGGMLDDLWRGGRPGSGERERCADMLDLLGLGSVADRPANTLSLGTGRLIEVARALMCEPRLLFLDEPSSGLDRSESEELAGTLAEVHERRNMAIVMIEHDVPLVRSLAQRTFVLDYGRCIASGPTEDVLADAMVRAAYLGVSS